MKNYTFTLLIGILPFLVHAQNDTVANFDPSEFTVELDTIEFNPFDNTAEVNFTIVGINLYEWSVESEYGWTLFIPNSSLLEDINGFMVENFDYTAGWDHPNDSIWIAHTTFVLSPGVTNINIRIGFGFIAHVLDSNENILYTDVTEYWSPTSYDLNLNQLITSVEEGEKPEIGFYPNPATDYITVQDSHEKTATITNMLGQMVRTIPTNEQVNIADLQRGVYYINRKQKLLIE